MATKKTPNKTGGKMPESVRRKRIASDSKWYAEYAKKCAKENEKKGKK